MSPGPLFRSDEFKKFLADLIADVNRIVGTIVHRHRIETVDPDVGGLEFLALQMGIEVQGGLGSGIGGQAVIGIAKGFVLHFAQIAQGGGDVYDFWGLTPEKQGLHQFDDSEDRNEIDLVYTFEFLQVQLIDLMPKTVDDFRIVYQKVQFSIGGLQMVFESFQTFR